MRKFTVFFAAFLFLLAGRSVHAQIYIALDGVEGESRFAAFKNSTELNSLSLEAENNVTVNTGVIGSGAGAGKPSFSEISFTKPRGVASSSFQNYLMTGRQFPKAEIRYYRAGQTDPYLVIYLENVFVTGWKFNSEKTEMPEESVSLKFIKIKTEDWLKNADGSIRKIASGWDVSKNMAF